MTISNLRNSFNNLHKQLTNSLGKKEEPNVNLTIAKYAKKKGLVLGMDENKVYAVLSEIDKDFSTQKVTNQTASDSKSANLLIELFNPDGPAVQQFFLYPALFGHVSGMEDYFNAFAKTKVSELLESTSKGQFPEKLSEVDLQNLDAIAYHAPDKDVFWVSGASVKAPSPQKNLRRALIEVNRQIRHLSAGSNDAKAISQAIRKFLPLSHPENGSIKPIELHKHFPAVAQSLEALFMAGNSERNDPSKENQTAFKKALETFKTELEKANSSN